MRFALFREWFFFSFCLLSFFPTWIERRAACWFSISSISNRKGGIHSFEFGEFGHEWVKDFDAADRERLRNLHNAWELPSEWDYFRHASHHLVPFGREVGLVERVGASSEG